MTKGFMRGLSLGIILTCLLIFLIDYPFSNDNKSVTENKTTLTDQNIHSALKERGQVAISTEELNRLQQLEKQQHSANEAQKEEAKVTEELEQAEQPETDTPIIYTIEVKSGMASIDISKKLAEMKIINNPDDLEKYLQEKDWARKIQIGSFEVSNKMSIDQISRKITKQ